MKLLQQMKLEHGHKKWQEACSRLEQDHIEFHARAIGGC